MTSVFDEYGEKQSDVDIHDFLEVLKESLDRRESVTGDLGSEARAEFDEFEHNGMLVGVARREEMGVSVGKFFDVFNGGVLFFPIIGFSNISTNSFPNQIRSQKHLLFNWTRSRIIQNLRRNYLLPNLLSIQTLRPPWKPFSLNMSTRLKLYLPLR